MFERSFAVNSFLRLFCNQQDYCTDPGYPCNGTIIGKYKITDTGIEFYGPNKVGVYEMNDKWMGNQKQIDSVALPLMQKKVYLSLKKFKDQVGELYMVTNQKPNARTEAKRKCASGSSEEVWVRAWTLEK